MRKLGWVVCVLVLIAMVAGTVLYAQAAGGAAGRRAGAGTMVRDRMLAGLQMLGLNDKEMAAAEKTVDAKLKARQALVDELDKLREVSETSAATDQQLRQAIDAYTKAMGRYRATVQAEDTALAKQLSLRSHARALAAGLLDNGLGGAGRMRTGGGRGGGGRRGGGPGRR